MQGQTGVAVGGRPKHMEGVTCDAWSGLPLYPRFLALPPSEPQDPHSPGYARLRHRSALNGVRGGLGAVHSPEAIAFGIPGGGAGDQNHCHSGPPGLGLPRYDK
jgi:hypothetical protein